ncbi:MAG: LysR substrate-binding domain-containing protein [Pseudomonadota bacterium]
MPRRLPNLNAIKAFDAAARHQSFTLAADELSVTHAAISRHVRSLELDLGVALFERRHRQVLLTREGARYAAVVEKALLSIALGSGDLKDGSDLQRIVLEVESDLAALWLLPRLDDPALAEAGIELDIRAQSGVAKTILAEADMALTWGHVEAHGFRSQPFLDFLAFPVCAPSWIAERDPTRGLAGLLPCRLIHERGPFWWTELLSAAGLSDDPQPGDGLYFNRSYLSLEAAAQGMGLAVGDDLTCAALLRQGRLVRPCGPDVVGKGQYYLMVPRKSPLPYATRFVRDWLHAEVKAHQQWREDWRKEQGIDMR